MALNYLKKYWYFLLLIFLCCKTTGQGLQVSYREPWGVVQLRYNNNVLINLDNNIGRPLNVESSKFIQKNGTSKVQWSIAGGNRWDNEKKQFSCYFNGVGLTTRYRQVQDTLYLDISLTNSSADVFSGVSICPLALNFGQRPKNFLQSYPYYANNIKAPAVITADMDTYKLVVENQDVSKKVYVGLLEENNTNGTLYRLWTGSHPYVGMQDFDPQSEIRLSPGKTYSFTIALKFCKPGVQLKNIASKTFSSYQKAHPFKIKWPDRRPIGSLFLASYNGNKNSQNPRNWTVTPLKNISLTKGEGIKELRKWLMEYANRSVGYLKKMDAQGMITWDIEGQEFPHPLSYIGSPDLVGKMAPEIESLADEYFAVFRKAGFKTGLCLRPDSVIFKGGWIDHVIVKDPAANLIRKINYARKRWGCTIFYVDSNVDPQTGLPMDYTVFKKVSEKFPDVLLIPEHESALYYGYTAPYEEMRSGAVLVKEDVKSIYPQAFWVLNVADGLKGSEKDDLRNLINCLNEGNILLFRAWFNDEPTNNLIKKAMNMSRH